MYNIKQQPNFQIFSSYYHYLSVTTQIESHFSSCTGAFDAITRSLLLIVKHSQDVFKRSERVGILTFTISQQLANSIC